MAVRLAEFRAAGFALLYLPCAVRGRGRGLLLNFGVFVPAIPMENR